MPQNKALLDAAERLFLAQGITATGVDVIVREARVSKPTLYAHFGSKAGLVEAVLKRRSDRFITSLEQLDTLDDVVEHLFALYTAPGSRGCAFLNAAAELTDAGDAGRAAVAEEKRALAGLLEERARATWLPSPARVAARLVLVLDGVAARAVVGGPAGARAALEDAQAIVDMVTAR